MDISTTEVQKPSGEFGIQIPMIALFVLILWMYYPNSNL